MDEELARNVFEQIHSHWVQPELARRFGDHVPPDFKIHRCLVRLPLGEPPIVEFNEEFGFVARAKMSGGGSITEGKEVHLHEIENVGPVQPISHNGKRVPFGMLLWQNGSWSMMFDFAPSDEPLESETPWSLSDRIANYIENNLAARAVALSAVQLDRLRHAGLWPAPALLPYPLSHINKHLECGDAAAAQATLVRHCTADFLKGLVSKWNSVEAFALREQLFNEAIEAHVRGRFSLSIYSLLPQIEGVMTDWLHHKSRLADIKWRQETKTGQFFEAIAGKTNLTQTGTKVVSGTSEFVLNGPVLQTFKKWDDAISDAFPGRHPVSHGKYEPDLLTECNSIKVFLLLDTLWHFAKL